MWIPCAGSPGSPWGAIALSVGDHDQSMAFTEINKGVMASHRERRNCSHRSLFQSVAHITLEPEDGCFSSGHYLVQDGVEP